MKMPCQNKINIHKYSYSSSYSSIWRSPKARTNVSVTSSRTVTVVCHFCMENRSSKILFSDLFPKTRSGGESQKFEFRFDKKNHDPFLDFSDFTVFGFHRKKSKILFFDFIFIPKVIHGYRCCSLKTKGVYIMANCTEVFPWNTAMKYCTEVLPWNTAVFHKNIKHFAR